MIRYRLLQNNTNLHKDINNKSYPLAKNKKCRSVFKTTKEECLMRTIKNKVLCFDIDGCLSMIVPSGKDMPNIYKESILKQIKCMLTDTPEDGKITHTRLTLRLFTNRKDEILDIANATKNETPSAKEIISELADIVSEWIDDSCTLYIDDRYHVEQVFGDASEGSYEELLRMQASSQTSMLSFLYNQSEIASHKVDLLAKIMSDYTSEPCTIYCFDDRFNPGNLDEGLESLIKFLEINPNTIPNNIELQCVMLDPFEDHKKHRSNMMKFINDKINQIAPFIGSVITEKDCDNRYMAMLKGFGMGELAAANDRSVEALLLDEYNVDITTQAGRDKYAQQQTALATVTIIQGQGSYPQIHPTELWEKILIPLGSSYHNFYCGSPSNTSLFSCTSAEDDNNSLHSNQHSLFTSNLQCKLGYDSSDNSPLKKRKHRSRDMIPGCQNNERATNLVP